MLSEQYVNTNSLFPRIFKYLLLTEFEGFTVSYRPIFFFPSIYGPSAKREGHESKGRNKDP